MGSRATGCWPTQTLAMDAEEKELLNKFLSLLILAVNQPNVNELEAYIQQDLETHLNFDRIISSMVLGELIHRTRAWYKDRLNPGPLDKAFLDDYGSQITRKQAEMISANQSYENCKELESHQIHFQVISFEDQLCTFLNNEKELICQIINGGVLILSAIKVLHCLKKFRIPYFLYIPDSRQKMLKIYALLNLFQNSDDYNILLFGVEGSTLDPEMAEELHGIVDHASPKAAAIGAGTAAIVAHFRAFHGAK